MSKIYRTQEQWRAQLTPQQFAVTREGHTERAFTGEDWDCQEDGIYTCVCCGAPLFDSRTKYDSGSGWPSFWAPLDPEAVETRPDGSLPLVRTEVLCAGCDAHLGHVFPDGPPPTRQRYCMNSAALVRRRRTPD